MKNNTQKKILYVITKSNFGGAQHYVFDLATHARRKYKISVAFGGNDLLKNKLENKGIETISIQNLQRNINPIKDLSALIELYKVFKLEKPQTIHLNSSKAGILGTIAGRFAGIQNIIFTSHGLVSDEDRGFISKSILRILTWITFVLSHKIILISVENKRRADKMLFIKNKTHLIHNAIQANTFLSKQNARDYISENYIKIPQNHTWIGTISELTPNKGLVNMMYVLKKLLKENNEISFLVFGEGTQRKKLENLIDKLNIKSHVHLLGFVENAQSYLSALDVFTLTSQKEGHPYALLEAANVCLPVVASNISGVKDIIKHQKNGLLIDPNDINTIIQAVGTLISDRHLGEKYGANLKASTEQTFSISKMLSSTIELY